MKVAIVGFGVVGKAYGQLFPDAVVYDPYSKDTFNGKPVRETTQEEVNSADIALVCVWTAGKEDGKLDMSIVDEVVGWLETPLILIKSALHPGTVDRLVEETGKRIAVSIEYIGEGNYYVPPEKYPDTKDPRKHRMIVVGGELEVAEACAEIIWSRLSPDTRIHLVTALEAEMCKLIENSYGSLKVTWSNAIRTLIEKNGQSFIRSHQAWTADGRVDSMHTRSVSYNKGWTSKCWDKDTRALKEFAVNSGADDLAKLMDTVIAINNDHLALNEKN